jgi:hypothetical protein
VAKYSREELMSLLEYSAKALGASDDEIYEFARCMRPDGTTFGTSGKCTPPNRPAAAVKLHQEADKLEQEAERVTSGGRRHSRSMQALAEKLRSEAKARRAAAQQG